MNNLNTKNLGLPFTGTALIGFAATNAALLVINKLIPLIDGSLMTELLPGAEAEIISFMTVVFAVAIGFIAFSYLLMALLGVNAIRFSKDPYAVKARTGLAKFLIFIGAVSFVSGLATVTDGATFWENASLLFPGLVQISFAVSYLTDVKNLQGQAKYSV